MMFYGFNYNFIILDFKKISLKKYTWSFCMGSLSSMDRCKLSGFTICSASRSGASWSSLSQALGPASLLTNPTGIKLARNSYLQSALRTASGAYYYRRGSRSPESESWSRRRMGDAFSSCDHGATRTETVNACDFNSTPMTPVTSRWPPPYRGASTGSDGHCAARVEDKEAVP